MFRKIEKIRFKVSDKYTCMMFLQGSLGGFVTFYCRYTINDGSVSK